MNTPTRLAAAALAALLLASPTANAAIIRRSALIQACTSKSPALLNNCAGYIAGVADTVDSNRDRVCIPAGLKVQLLRVGVNNYLQSHTTTDGPAAPSVVTALQSLYKCIG